jgi:glucose-6-phosphate-specific signal transduction histidine kinase
MQTLNSKHKMLAIIISAIGLLGFPCGTILSAYLLYLLLSPKGEMVFSEGYKDIVRATPHIKYRTSIIVWILLFLLIGILAFFIIGGVMSANRFS